MRPVFRMSTVISCALVAIIWLHGAVLLNAFRTSVDVQKRFLLPVGTAGHCGEQLVNANSRIVGGTEAKLGEIPWQVGLVYSYTVICGGSLVGTRWVLLAAHCVDDVIGPSSGQLSVLVSTTWLNHTRLSNFIGVDSITMYPGFDNTTNDHDIALIKLKKPVSGSHVRPICLPAKGKSFQGFTCLTSGWGDIVENSYMGAKQLRKVSVKVQPRANCTDSLGKYFKGFHLCAGWPEGGRDACLGDSGGPLACRTQGPSSVKVKGSGQWSYWTLAGVVSSGYRCGQPGKYGLYTDVQQYLDWIHSTMKQTSGFTQP